MNKDLITLKTVSLVLVGAVFVGTFFLSKQVYAATNYFDWDVETGTLDGTFDIYDDPSAVAITTAKAHSGSKSVFYNPNAPGADATNSPVIYLPDLNTVYLSFWWWIPSSLEGGEGGQHFFRFGSTADANYLTNGQIDPAIASPGAQGFGFDLFDGGAGDSGTTYHSVCGDLPTNQWFKFALLATINSPGGTANGTLKCWVNDVERFSSTSVLFATSGAPLLTTKWNRFILVTNWENTTLEANSQWWMDDVEVWDGVPTGDTSAPMAPTGLGVQ
ncbi:MAG: hypothetical protein WBP40_00915 [Candidatus Moraniibacteriota bacterium]